MAWADLIITIMMIENCLIIFKALVAAAIPDNPGWIEDEMLANQHRVKQVQSEVQDKTIMQMNGDEGMSPLQFVEHCLTQLHHDRDLASLLVNKLLRGCQKF